MVTRTIYKTAICQTFHKCGIKSSLKHSRDSLGRKNCITRPFSDITQSSTNNTSNKIGDKCYAVDSWTNITPKILSYKDRNLHNQKYHPLQLIKQRIVNYIYSYYPGRKAPLFSVYDKVRTNILPQWFDPKIKFNVTPTPGYFPPKCPLIMLSA